MKRLLLVALMVLMTLIGIVGFSRAGNTVIALQATGNHGVSAKPNLYYLTATGFTGMTPSRLVIPDSTWPVYPKSRTPVRCNTPPGTNSCTTTLTR